jgi:hypothetical protein
MGYKKIEKKEEQKRGHNKEDQWERRIDNCNC